MGIGRWRRVPVVRQRDSMQCGVACLAMICRFYGRHTTVDELGNLCHMARNGVSLKGIADAASDIGLESSAGRVTLDGLAGCPLPAILHWNQNHFVVLEHIGGNGRRFHVADPAKGRVTYGREEFSRRWLSTTSQGERKGIAMLFETTGEFERRKNAADEGRRSMRFLAGYLGRYRAFFFQILLGLLLACVLQLAMPFLTQAIVDTGISRRDIGVIWLILLGELMIVAGRTATDFIRRWLLLHISMRINISLLSDFFIKLLRLPMAFFDTRLTGDLLQRMGDHTRVQTFLTGQTLGVMFTSVSFVVFGAVLFIYDLRVFLIFLAGSVIYALWTVSFLHRRRLLDYEMFECQSANQSRTYQFVTGMQEIKLQGCGTRRRHEWEDIQADLFMVQMKSMRLQQTQEAGSVFINELKNILITVFAASAVIDGGMTLGAMLAVQYIVGQLNSPVEQLMTFIYSLQDVRISLERINEVHCRADEGREGAGAEPPAGASPITLRNVSFRYDRHALSDTLSDIDLEVRPGDVTAIVGASGSGKTTVVRLMLGYYPPLSGAVEVGGIPLADMSPDMWRARCGAVMQEGVIFSESIERNIAVGDGDVDRDRMREAARIACIDSYVESLPLKYDTVVGDDGTGLSRGQKQRILIARAVYRNPDFIFLDEATNALDAKNERDIVENLRDFYRGKTVVVVAHRLSTVRDADRIVVMDGGRIVETGTHAELTALRGVYYTLVGNQLELGD